MKKIIFLAKLVFGIIMVLVAAYSISPFRGMADLILGAALMLAGVILAVFLEGWRRRIFFLLSIFSLAVTYSLQFFPLFSFVQYFFGGILVYFACAVVLNGNKGATNP